MDNIAIEFKDVWEKYLIKFILDGKARLEELWALKEVNFKVNQKEGVAIIGENGAGKTTILKLISGILKPDKGEININGRVSGLLDLGAGFQPELTGRQNIYLNAALFGLKREEIDAKFDEILEFSGIGRFIDATCNSLSQGMFVRLAFSLAIHIDPDIIVIDDTLAVGDAEYQKKCIKKIFELREQNKTIILVTHDLNTASRLCARGIFMKEGQIMQDTSFKKVAASYMQTVGSKKGVSLIKDDPLTVIFNNGKMCLNWMGVSLTKHLSGYVSFTTGNKEHISNEYLWRVENESPEKIVARGEHLAVPISQNWEIEYRKPGEINWKVELLSKEAIQINEETVHLVLGEQFNRWIDLESEGFFPEYFLPGDNCNNVFLADYKCKRFFGIVGNSMEGDPMPSILVETPEEDSSINVLNSGQQIRGRIIQLKDEVFSDETLPSMMKKVFIGKLRIFDTEDNMRRYIAAKRDERAVKNGPIKVCIYNNKIKIFFNEKEVTEDIGLHVLFQIKGRWYNSQGAAIKIKEKSGNKSLLEFRWPALNIRQLWHIAILDTGEIELNIYMCAGARISSNNRRIRLVLNRDYNKWFTLACFGNFSEEPTDWESIIEKGPGPLGIGVKDERANENSLPGILLELTDKSKGIMSKINQLIDMDKNIRFSKILEAEDSSTFYLDQEPDIIFSAKIKIIQSNSEIDSMIEDNRRRKEELLKRELAEYARDHTIERGSYRIFVDEKDRKLLLYYRDILLTKDCGIESVFYADEKWYHSSGAGWGVKKASEDCMLLEFSWQDKKGLTQEVKIVLMEGSLLLESGINSDDLLISGLRQSLIIKDLYIKAFFEDFVINLPKEYKGQEFRFGDGLKPEYIGLRPKGDLPAIVIKCSGDLKVRNSDAIIKSRRLDMETTERCLKAEVELIEDLNRVDSAIEEARMKKEELLVIEEARRKEQELLEKQLTEEIHEKETLKDIQIERGDIKLILDKPPGFSAYYKGKALSKNNFLDTSYLYGGKERKTELEGLRVKILQHSRSKLKLLLYKWNIPIQQIWTVCINNGYIDWHVELLVKKKVPIYNKQVIVNVQNVFTKWFTAYESGEFSKSPLSKKSAVVRFARPNAHKIGIKTERPAAAAMVSLVCSNEKDYIVDCFTKKDQITLKGLEINDIKRTRHSKGKHKFFTGRIFISDNKHNGMIYRRDDENGRIVIKGGSLKLKFLKGKGRIYFANKEVTTGLGLYSAVFSNNRWIDSSQARWRVLKKNKNGFIAEGFWAWIPLIQRWHLQIDKAGRILWDIKTKIYDKVKIDLEQANLMLRRSYNKWDIDGKAMGIFPKDFEDLDLDNYWERLYYGAAKNSFVVVENKDNRILYKSLISDENLKLVVENSDTFYKGRVIQYRRINVKKRRGMKTMITIREV